MALNKAGLKSDILSVFSDMADAAGSDNPKDDAFMCEGIASAVETYIKGMTCITSDMKGTISAGMFTQVSPATATIETDTSGLESELKDACSTMAQSAGKDGGTEDKLPAAFVSGMDRVMSKTKAKFATVNGNAVQGSSSSSVSGPAEGSFSGSNTAIQTALTAAASVMANAAGTDNPKDDDYYAGEIANAVDTAVKAWQCAVQGQQALSGAIGTGVIS